MGITLFIIINLFSYLCIYLFIYSRCKNNLCIDKSKVCDYADDCGDLSDEDPNGVCLNYIGCNFDSGQCQFIQNNTDDFDWQMNIGETPSANTGPTHDHTFLTSNG